MTAEVAHVLLEELPRQSVKSIEEARMADIAKCAHPACNCMVTKGGDFGKYCSETCKEKGDQTELRCDCRHPGCR